MQYVASEEVKAIRERLDHPIIDGDGHLIEYTPLVRDFLVEIAGEDVAKRFDTLSEGSRLARQVPVEKRRELGMTRFAWWGLPAANTLDRATAMLPGLMYERMEEIGLDFALLFPTYGLAVTALGDDEVRRASARAYNRYYAEVYSEFRDRLEPVAAIPMFTPEEAILELDYAIGELGLKSVMCSGVIPRPIKGCEDIRAARWIDTLGHDSEYDYDPVWQRCEELGVSPTFHSSGQGLASRASRQNYVYNHIGNFAWAGEAACRSLFMGGVPRRFPKLRFGFLEGGVAWAANLYSDILGHYEKRNRNSIGHYDPKELDKKEMQSLIAKYGAKTVQDRSHRLDEALLMLSDPDEDRSTLDEFAESAVDGVDDIRAIFEQQFFFGCEADDPMNAIAFDRSKIPHRARLRPIFASDIGHWDVPDFRGVLPEAWELVEGGHVDMADFRAFTCQNIADLLTGTNPKFFDGTVIEGRL